jgi:hypothetical protein
MAHEMWHVKILSGRDTRPVLESVGGLAQIFDQIRGCLVVINRRGSTPKRPTKSSTPRAGAAGAGQYERIFLRGANTIHLPDSMADRYFGEPRHDPCFCDPVPILLFSAGATVPRTDIAGSHSCVFLEATRTVP